MSEREGFVHPYIPNSAPENRQKMMEVVGIDHLDELYESIPHELKLNRPLNIPDPFLSELDLKRHVQAMLDKNADCEEYISFLGGACWQHYVPAVCDEIASRAEFLTAYGGDTYADLGKYQAIFEFQSMVAELVGMEIVSAPSYDWVTSATSSLLMATRITGRRRVLVASTVNPELLKHFETFAAPWADLDLVDHDPATGLLDLTDLESKLSDQVAAVYVENPSFLGFIEANAQSISDLAHSHGALSIVGLDASSLGILAAPADYGADIVCGEVQSLGNHMHYGGGLCGFIASRDDPDYVLEYPTFLVSIAPTEYEDEWGFGWALMSRTSFDQRETAPDFTGSSQWLWGIVAGAYLAMLGPQGIGELGEGIMQRSNYAMQRLNEIDGVTAPAFNSSHFKEFVVSFQHTGKTVAEINEGLKERGIFGGHDLSNDFPSLGQSALYCVTEIHTKAQIDKLADALTEVL